MTDHNFSFQATYNTDVLIFFNGFQNTSELFFHPEPNASLSIARRRLNQ